MQLGRVWLKDFRSYEEAEVLPAEGLTVVLGGNGEGKTSLLEAIAYLATLSSFRGAPGEALVRRGADRAFLRAEGSREGRAVLLEAEVTPGGRGRVQVNRQRLARSRDLLGFLRVTVFSPDDLVLVKGGPGGRRAWLDDLLSALHPRNDALRQDLDRVLRQRNALLRRAGGRLTTETATTLEVWDDKLVTLGEQVAAARTDLLGRLAPVLAAAYDQVARRPASVTAHEESAWRTEGLAAALAAARADELRRGVSLVGPHRDEIRFEIDGMPARTHSSQGEQRSLALALRLAGHAEVTNTVGSAPVLLLDDVFSELDPGRSSALVGALPGGQALLSSASGVPKDVQPDLVVHVSGGRLST